MYRHSKDDFEKLDNKGKLALINQKKNKVIVS